MTRSASTAANPSSDAITPADRINARDTRGTRRRAVTRGALERGESSRTPTAERVSCILGISDQRVDACGGQTTRKASSVSRFSAICLTRASMTLSGQQRLGRPRDPRVEFDDDSDAAANSDCYTKLFSSPSDFGRRSLLLSRQTPFAPMFHCGTRKRDRCLLNRCAFVAGGVRQSEN